MTKKPQIDKCPCGSGKPAHLCCESEKERASRIRQIVVSTLIVITLGGLVALAVTRPAELGVTSQPLIGTAAPEPYSYDPVQNKHYDPSPGHQHWHSGPPPAGKTGPIVDAPPDTATAVDTVETIPNPEPWQYNPLTDKHWHAGHGHWHDGRPPANAGATSPTLTIPATTEPTGG